MCVVYVFYRRIHPSASKLAPKLIAPKSHVPAQFRRLATALSTRFPYAARRARASAPPPAALARASARDTCGKGHRECVHVPRCANLWQYRAPGMGARSSFRETCFGAPVFAPEAFRETLLSPTGARASSVTCGGASSEVHIFLARRAPGCGGSPRGANVNGICPGGGHCASERGTTSGASSSDAARYETSSAWK